MSDITRLALINKGEGWNLYPRPFGQYVPYEDHKKILFQDTFTAYEQGVAMGLRIAAERVEAMPAWLDYEILRDTVPKADVLAVIQGDNDND